MNIKKFKKEIKAIEQKRKKYMIERAFFMNKVGPPIAKRGKFKEREFTYHFSAIIPQPLEDVINMKLQQETAKWNKLSRSERKKVARPTRSQVGVDRMLRNLKEDLEELINEQTRVRVRLK